MITLGNNTGPGSIFVGVGNTSVIATPTREQLYNCVDGNNVTLYICRRFILPSSSVETLFSVSGKENQVYVAATNSYVYRPLGSDKPTGTTVTAPGTAINIEPSAIVIARGDCSSDVSVAIGGSAPAAPPTEVSIMLAAATGIYYQDSGANIITSVTIANPAKSATFRVCVAPDAAPSIVPVAITVGGADRAEYYTSKG